MIGVVGFFLSPIRARSLLLSSNFGADPASWRLTDLLSPGAPRCKSLCRGLFLARAYNGVMDNKLQLNRGSRAPEDWDQRKSTGQFQGSPEDVHVKTVAEFRTDDDILINPDRLAEFIQPGDNLVMVINRALRLITKDQPSALKDLASLGGLKGTGPVGLDLLVYDND